MGKALRGNTRGLCGYRVGSVGGEWLCAPVRKDPETAHSASAGNTYFEFWRKLDKA